MHSTGCRFCSGTLALPVANLLIWSLQCVVHSTPCFYKRPETTSSTSQTNSVYTNDDDLVILLNRDTFLPNAIKYPISEESTSKAAWGLKALVNQGHLRRPPMGAPKTVTLCTVHLHNVVAKKRDAAISLLQRLYAHTKMLDGDFIGGDFNLAVRGPVADVFSDTEFMCQGTIPLRRAGNLPIDASDCTGFKCVLQRPFYWFVKNYGIHTFENAQLGLNERDESTHYPVFMYLWATRIPGGTRASLRSDAAQARRIQRAATKNDRKRQRRLNQAAANNVDNADSTSSAGQLQPTLLNRYEERIEKPFCSESSFAPLVVWMRCANSHQSHCLILTRPLRT